MAGHDDVAWVQHLEPEECWGLLRGAAVGRLGVLIDSAPEIFPVNFAILDDTIVFRTDDGTKQRGLRRSPSVCFEVDHIDDESHSGWSVLVKGHAEEVDTRDIDGAELGGLAPWGVTEGSRWIRIVPEDITGRHLGHTR